MKLKVAGEKEIKKEPEVSLKLFSDDLGVVVGVVDEKGEFVKNSSIVRILLSGELVRLPNLSKSLIEMGIKVNDKGQILLVQDKVK